MKRKQIPALLFTLALLILLSVTASALTIDGEEYDHTMQCAQATDSFGSYNTVNAVNADSGHTANLIGDSQAIPSYGYWYNAAIGYDASLQYGAGAYVNGTEVVSVLATEWQMNNVNTVGGFVGNLESPYRGLSLYESSSYYAPSWAPGHRRLVVFWTIPQNSVSANINGLDENDAAGAQIVVTGAGLPDSGGYGSDETYSCSGNISFNDTVRYGNYYVSVYIPNAGNYDITYQVKYMPGSKYADQGNFRSDQTYQGSDSFSTNSYYVESDGFIDVTVTAHKKGTVIVDLHKGTGVTESYAGKVFALYSAAGNYVASAMTNNNGYAYFYNCSYGVYTIKPVGTPSGCYYSPSTVSVTLNSPSVTGRITLYRSTGTLKINHTTEDGLDRGNVKFKVTNPKGIVAYYNTDSSGQIVLGSVITGSYMVEQIRAPDDNDPVTVEYTVTVYRSATTTVTFYNPILYDFSVEVSALQSVEQMQSLTGTVMFSNKGGKNATGVPVKVKYGGQAIYNAAISVPANSSVTKTFVLDTSAVGSKQLWASINISGTKRERYFSDNTDSQWITITTSTNLQIEFIEPNSAYREGTEVISSFRVKNEGYNHITLDDNLKVSLAVTYSVDRAQKSISIDNKDQVIIPYGGDNLVFFKWTVPGGTAGCQFKLVAAIDPDFSVDETNDGDNTVTVYRTIEPATVSTTPDTQYEGSVPDGFSLVSTPYRSSCTSLSWSVWEWVNNWFVKKTYGLQISSSSPNIVPDSTIASSKYANGVWSMGSGYGYTADWKVDLLTVSGTSSPDTTAYTSPQTASLYLPEYQYSNTIGKFCTLKKIGTNSFCLPNNPNAKSNSELHFTPLYFPDGRYICQGYVADIWTPAGMLYEYCNSNVIKITDSAYDDWYIHNGG